MAATLTELSNRRGFDAHLQQAITQVTEAAGFLMEQGALELGGRCLQCREGRA